MVVLRIGTSAYPLSGTDGEIALAHAIGCAFVELQQLEFTIISFLGILTNGAVDADNSFDLFASKTFGNLIREMIKLPITAPLAEDMRQTKERRDFFVHKFLFHRYGGTVFTTEADYELLVRDAIQTAKLFAKSREAFDDLMLTSAPVVMFAGRYDEKTGEIDIVESTHAKSRRS
jgi:hypothetical protein